jgi:arabinose-5-phosphate isomerase
MERKGFSTDQYRDLHPAGALGRALIRVCDLMHKEGEFPLVTADTPMKEILLLMTSFGRFGFAGVVGIKDENGKLIGIFTDGDLRRHIHGSPLDHVAGDLMTKNPKTIAAGRLAAEALAVMNAQRITSLFVVADDAQGASAPIGLIHIHDCLRAGLR